MTPRLFRVILQVDDLERAAHFYRELLAIAGRSVGGGRYYIDCGDVILALLDVSGGSERPRPNPDYLYLAVDDLDAVHARATRLHALSAGTVHGDSAGQITTRPWGERSFYVRDPWGNGLCFVDAATLFSGR